MKSRHDGLPWSFLSKWSTWESLNIDTVIRFLQRAEGTKDHERTDGESHADNETLRVFASLHAAFLTIINWLC